MKDRMREKMGRERAQTLVEFALTLPIFLLILFGLIEFGFLFQAWLTVQNSAQAGTRFAVTGRGYADPTVDAWDQNRLQLIKDQVRNAGRSLRIDDSASPLQPGYFNVKIHASNLPEPTPGAEYPGGPNDRVAVDVTFNHELMTPIVHSIVPWIRLRAHSEMINERFRHPGYGTPPGELPPTIEPTPVRWYIAGYVYTTEGAPIGGVTISGLPDAPVTDSSGYYFAQVDDGWSGVVMPQLAPYVFNPITRTYSNVSADRPGQDYTGY
jgi:hypothetical protein